MTRDQAEERTWRRLVHVPPCRCRHGHQHHVFDAGVNLSWSLGPCLQCRCPDWYPEWHDRVRFLRRLHENDPRRVAA